MGMPRMRAGTGVSGTRKVVNKVPDGLGFGFVSTIFKELEMESRTINQDMEWCVVCWCE